MTPRRHSGISVVIPVFNDGRKLPSAVSDLLPQLTMPKDELIIVENGSTDDSWQIVQSLAEADHRVRILKVSTAGLSKALNLGIREASNEVIARADADDRYPAGRLLDQESRLTGATAAVFGDYEFCSSGRALGRIPSAIGSPLVALSLIHGARTPHPGSMFMREAFLDAGGYRNHEEPAEDLGLWLRMAQTGDLISTPNIVVQYHAGSGSVWKKKISERRVAANHVFERNAPSRKWLEDAFGEVAATVRLYQNFDLCEQRILLAMWDARAWSKRYGIKPPSLTVLGRPLTIRPMQSLRAILKLESERRMRKSS